MTTPARRPLSGPRATSATIGHLATRYASEPRDPYAWTIHERSGDPPIDTGHLERLRDANLARGLSSQVARHAAEICYKDGHAWEQHGDKGLWRCAICHQEAEELG